MKDMFAKLFLFSTLKVCLVEDELGRKQIMISFCKTSRIIFLYTFVVNFEGLLVVDKLGNLISDSIFSSFTIHNLMMLAGPPHFEKSQLFVIIFGLFHENPHFKNRNCV